MVRTDIRSDSERTPNRRSETEIRNGLPRTNERTDGESGSVVNLVTKVDARRSEEDFAALGDVLDAGLWPTGERHPIIRAGERDPIPSWTRAAVWFRDRGRCRLCPPHQNIEGPWHLDHIKPWSAGGSDRSDNLRVLCETHNLERSNKIIAEERPESLVTWWCARCYMLDEHAWYYDPLPDCPTHNSGGRWLDVNPRCRVQRAYKSHFVRTSEWPTWHQTATPLTELHTIAYCAHCNLRGLTGVTL